METGPDLSKGGTGMIAIKDFAPLIAALVAIGGGWWAWRTSYLRALADRVAVLEARDEARSREVGAAQLRVAELTAELTLERDRRKTAEGEASKWQARWHARRTRQRHDSLHPEGGPGSLEEDTSDGDALDDHAADSSGLHRIPPGGHAK